MLRQRYRQVFVGSKLTYDVRYRRVVVTLFLSLCAAISDAVVCPSHVK